MGLILLVHVIAVEGNEMRFQEENSAIRGMNAPSLSIAHVISTQISHNSTHVF
jgi:hypothetical protein